MKRRLSYDAWLAWFLLGYVIGKYVPPDDPLWRSIDALKMKDVP